MTVKTNIAVIKQIYKEKQDYEDVSGVKFERESKQDKSPRKNV